jgi:O-antigen/teichoic acid export membrane protein
MGLATGVLLRFTENLGRGQQILSTPGLLSLALMVFWLTTYEMAASTFAAAVFQIVVVVLLVGWWFGRQPTRLRQVA